MPPSGGNGSDKFRPFVQRSDIARPPGSGRHFNPYWYSGWRRRAPIFWLRASRQQSRGMGWWWAFAALLLFVVGGTVGLAAVAVVAPISVGTALYTERYNSLGLDKEYSLTFETTRIYDRRGQLIYEKQPEEGLREYLVYSKVPKVLIEATTAAEDPTFFENKGYDPYAIVRAVFINISGRGSSGASTITQQVARLLYLPPQQRAELSPDRKLDEIILAIKLTDNLSKEQILEKYLNNIYYGNLAYGIQAASLGYFGKNAGELDLAEASMLAGLPQAPSLYDPTINYELARRRQRIVLDLMVRYNRVSQAEADAAYRVNLQERLVDKRKRQTAIKAPHFVNYILQQLEGELPSAQLASTGLTTEDFKRGGFDIYTSIDLTMNDKAQEIVKGSVEELKKRRASNSALVAIRPDTGEILAMVGSTDYYDEQNQGQFNAALARRQPGSALKPFTYAFAMKKGWTAATVLADVVTQFPSNGSTPYSPQNFDGKTRGPVAVRQALGSSLNIPAVRALQYVGVETFMNEAKDLGITFQYGPERYGLTLTLGGGEVRLLDLVDAYTVFPNLGERVEAVSFLKITRRGETIYEYGAEKARKRAVLSPQISYVITDILSDNEARLLAFDRNNPLVLPNGRKAAAKTGTSNDFVDSWTVGYTPNLIAGIWVGNNNNKPMDGVAGSVGAGIIWNRFMTEVYNNPALTDQIKQSGAIINDFAKPGDLEEVTVCVESGLLPNDACPQKRKELFPRIDVPKGVSNVHQFVKVPKKITPPLPLEVGPGLTPMPTATPYVSDFDCLPDSSWPDTELEQKLFYIYPPELQQWGAKLGRKPPPTQPCPTYQTPTPTATPSPTPTPTPSPTITATVADTPIVVGPGETPSGPPPTPAGPLPSVPAQTTPPVKPTTAQPPQTPRPPTPPPPTATKKP